MKELTKQTVVHVVGCRGKMAGVMHMMGTLHTIGSRIGHSLVTVQSRQ